MILELAINGAHVIVSGENLTISVTEENDRSSREKPRRVGGRPDIVEAEIRKSLIDRAEAFCQARKTSFSAIGIAAVQDSKFLSRVANPDLGFNIKTYQKVVEWLDAAERTEAAE